MYILAIDQGTTSTRAVIFDAAMQLVSTAQSEIKTFYPQKAWVEQNPLEIWQSVQTTVQQALSKAKLTAKDINAIGISNQRETTVLWDKRTGEPVYPAIVWQDRRTYEQCQQLSKEGWLPSIHQKTGLVIDPYFSASKIQWILTQVPQARTLMAEQQLLFGTIETYLIWQMTQGQSHVTDITNAARTMLYDIRQCQWDVELLKLFDIPKDILPTVIANVGMRGITCPTVFGAAIPILASAGDQQAASIGQCCFTPGMLKSTYGTGCFLLLNTGTQILTSKHNLLTTIAYQAGSQIHYALEGSIFVAGAAVQWLRDAMHLITKASDSEEIALSLTDNDGVYLVPAFTGLGAPYWDPLARGAILGLTRDTGVKHIVRAALEAVCYQTRDLLQAMQDDGASVLSLRVDGGMASNNWLMQFLADITDKDIYRPKLVETTALGVAYLAGLALGIFTSLEQIAQHWQQDKLFKPQMSSERREQLYKGWLAAVHQIINRV